MSQEMSYQRVMTIREANNFQRQMSTVIAQVMNSAPAEVKADVKKCCKKKRTKAKSLMAPSEMKIIQTDYNRHLAMAERQTTGKVEQLKVAAITTLEKSQDNLLVSEPSVVADKIHHIIEAQTVQDVTREIKATFKEIKSQHSKTFVSNISTAVQESAVAIGFRNVSIQEPHMGMIRVVATNQTGQNLIAEIEIERQVDIRTELIGYTDGSCEKVIRAFDDEMISRGITTRKKEQKSTHGIPHLPYAKRILKPRVFQQRTFADETQISRAGNETTITIKR